MLEAHVAKLLHGKFITLQSQCLPPNVTIPRDCLAPDNFPEKRAIGVAVHDSMLEDPLLKSGSIQRYFAELCVLHEGLKHRIKPRLSLAKQSFKANIQRSTVDNVKTCKDPITDSYRSYRHPIDATASEAPKTQSIVHDKTKTDHVMLSTQGQRYTQSWRSLAQDTPAVDGRRRLAYCTSVYQCQLVT